MKTTYFLSLFCISLLFFACNNDDAPDTPKITLTECGDFTPEVGEITEALAYEIIDAVVQNDFANKPFVHILRETAPAILGSNIEEDLEYLASSGATNVESELLEAHFTKNAVVSSWNDSFERATVFADAEYECFLADFAVACESYQAKYPDASGFIKFSMPAILNNLAILEYEISPCIGSSVSFVLLEKKNDVWVVNNSFTFIVS